MASLPGAAQLVDASFSTGTRALGVARDLVQLPGRLMRMVDSTEVLLTRVDVLLLRTERLMDEAERTVSHTQGLVPVLQGLDRLGPDVAELLRVTDEVRRTVLGIPGFSLLRRRGGGPVEVPVEVLDAGPDRDVERATEGSGDMP